VAEACLFDIMEVPADTLQRVLPKISIRTVSRLVAAYPRAVGRTLLQIMAKSMSPATIDLLKEQIDTNRLPSSHQVYEAEKEFVKILREHSPLQAARV
jgi:flagellar FliG-like protein